MQQLLYDLPLCLLIAGCLCETLLSEELPQPRDLQVGVTTGLSVGYTISLNQCCSIAAPGDDVSALRRRQPQTASGWMAVRHA